MSTQNNLEEIIKKIHLMISSNPHVKGDPNRVVIDKNELFSYLEDISRCMYDMLDEYKLTKEQKNEQLRHIKDEEKRMVESATRTVEDMYSASALYTDSAIGRLVKILEESQRSFDHIYADFNKRMAEEKANLRGNQKVLEEQLFDMKDSGFYMNLLEDSRRRLEQEKAENQKAFAKMEHSGEGNYPAPEIKINQAYFDQMGLNPDGTKKEDPAPESAGTPEVVVNLDANYFKWKNSEKSANTVDKDEGEEDESTE